MRRRYSSDQWLEWLLEQPGSGLSIRKFCAAKGVSENSFYLWRRKLRKELRQARREPTQKVLAPSFVPVEVVAGNHVAVELPCGATAKVPTDESSLKIVFQVLLELGSPS